MKNLNMKIVLFLIASIVFSCETNIIPEEVVAQDDQRPGIESKNSSQAQAIVLSAPSVNDNYYAAIFDDIVDFQVNLANQIQGRDEVIILVDNATRPYYQGRVPNYVLVSANIKDIWIRDFAPVMAAKQVKFNYRPDYLSTGDANFVDNSFERWYRNVGLQYGRKTSLILDGGNVVSNGSDKVVVTERFLTDNNLSRNKAKRRLKNLLGVTQVAIIKETPDDTTGHADGMVMWTDDNTLILNDQPASVKNQIINELESSFPGVNVIVVPDYYVDAVWNGFVSACNIYVNSLVTNNYIYVPTFNSSNDQSMINFIQSTTTKQVVAIPASGVCFMGGSVRCLTWQLDGVYADDILQE